MWRQNEGINNPNYLKIVSIALKFASITAAYPAPLQHNVNQYSIQVCLESINGFQL